MKTLSQSHDDVIRGGCQPHSGAVDRAQTYEHSIWRPPGTWQSALYNGSLRKPAGRGNCCRAWWCVTSRETRRSPTKFTFYSSASSEAKRESALRTELADIVDWETTWSEQWQVLKST